MLFISCSSWLWPILPYTENIHRDTENFYMAAKNEDQRIWPSKLKEKHSNTSCKTCSGLGAVAASWLTQSPVLFPAWLHKHRCQRAEQPAEPSVPFDGPAGDTRAPRTGKGTFHSATSQHCCSQPFLTTEAALHIPQPLRPRKNRYKMCFRAH